MPILSKENNVISLRIAQVFDDGNVAGLHLNPADFGPLIPKGRKWWAPKDFEWVYRDSVWLYRHMRSAAAEAELMRAYRDR